MRILQQMTVLSSAALVLAGAGGSGSLQQEQPPRFRAEVAAVLVDVLVLDEQGDPVSGLTVDEFEIFEDGVQQEIQDFDAIDWTSYVAAASPLEETAPATAVSTTTFPRRFIFIINRQGARFGFMVRARRALESFVVESMADGDQAAVIDIGESTRVLQDFTPFKEEILQAVKRIYPMRANIFFGTQIATRNVFDALDGLGQDMSAVPGRKIVIFMSPALERTAQLLPDLQRTVDSLNQSNTTLYAVDIEGTAGAVLAEDEEITFESLGGYNDGDTSAADFSSMDGFEIGGLFPLANETGGRYFWNTNTFEPVVRRIGAENRRYYLLTYTSTNSVIDTKKFRRIEVRVDRSDLTVRARKGYFPRKAGDVVVAEASDAPPGQPTTPARPAPVPKASKEDKPPSPPPIAAAIRPPSQVEITNYLFPRGDGKVEVPIAVALPRELVTDESGQAASRILKLTVTDNSGTIFATMSGTVDPENFSMVRSANLDPGSYLLQISLEAGDELVYESSTQVDVPSEYGDRFGISSIVFFLPPEAQKSTDDGPPIRPTSTVRVGEDVFIHYRVFPGKTDTPSKNVSVSYSIYRDDQELKSFEQPKPLDLTKATEFGIPALAKLPTSQLAPGLYRIVVRVTDSSLGRRATGEIMVTVSP